MKLVVAIDVGTQSTRSAVVGQDGAILVSAGVDHELHTPRPGWAEQRPDGWWTETCETLRTVLRDPRVDDGAIAAVAVCGQMHGPVGIDESGGVTTPWVQTWADKRSVDQCDRLVADHDEASLRELTANPVLPAWTGIKVSWERDNHPDAYGRTRWYLVPKDFVNLRLTGVAATDHSEASCTYLYDRRSGTYSAELADALGIDIERFAPINRSVEVVGEVTDEAAAATGLRPGLPVVAGGGDFPTSMLGFGIVGEGVSADVTGTSTLVAAHSRDPLVDPAIQNCRHVVDGWVPFTLLDSGGLSMRWCRQLVSSMRGSEISYEELVALAEEAPAGSEGLYFYPYLMGERRRDNVAAKGGYLGISLEHSAPHFVRAVMEGVAFAMGRDLAQFASHGHRSSRLMSVGGGTRNELWNRIKAAVVDAPLDVSDEPEAGLKGAAILALTGVGIVDDAVKAALEWRTRQRTVEPDRDMAAVYRSAQVEFERIYERMLGFWPG